MVDTEKWLTRAEAAELLRVGLQTVDRHAKAGRLTRYRLGGTRATRFRIEDVRSLLIAEAQPESRDEGEK